MTFNQMRGARKSVGYRVLGKIFLAAIIFFSMRGKTKGPETWSPAVLLLLNKPVLAWPNLWSSCYVITHILVE